MAEGELGTIYLIHLDRPYHHARHYLGLAKHLESRLAHHRNGTGARLLEVVGEAGIGWRVVRKWRGSRGDERRLKNRKDSPRLCPICAAAAGHNVREHQLDEIQV